MKRYRFIAVLFLLLIGCAYKGDVPPVREAVAMPPVPRPGIKPEVRQDCTLLSKGVASWYGYELAGNHTANGEKFDPEGLTAAHRSLPFGTKLKVTLDNGKGNPDGVYVRVNDRGPFKRGRIIDLSWGAAKELGMMDTQKVHIYKCS